MQKTVHDDRTESYKIYCYYKFRAHLEPALTVLKNRTKDKLALCSVLPAKRVGTPKTTVTDHLNVGSVLELNWPKRVKNQDRRSQLVRLLTRTILPTTVDAQTKRKECKSPGILKIKI